MSHKIQDRRFYLRHIQDRQFYLKQMGPQRTATNDSICTMLYIPDKFTSINFT